MFAFLLPPRRTPQVLPYISNASIPCWGTHLKQKFGVLPKGLAPNPRMYPRTEDGPDEPENREYYIARFKYRVIYAIWKEEAVIIAVLHATRQPGS